MSNSTIRLALFQPDIPQNAGTLLRLGACLGLGLDIIEPCGFLWDDKRMRRAGMDYLDRVDVVRHSSWAQFQNWRQDAARRLVLLTTKGADRLDHFVFQTGDVLLAGRESAGVPPEVAQAADAAIRIPMAPHLRSLNVAVASSLAAWEALRQTGTLPTDTEETEA